MAARRVQHSVVPYRVTEEQERLRQAAAGGTVVEHLHVASVGHCIRRSAGELVVQFVSRNDTYRKVVVRTVEVGQTFGLFQELLACRNDDDHVGRSVCMMVLVGDVVDVFRYREVRFQRGYRRWCRIGHGDVIEPCRTALGYFDCHFVLGRKLLNVGKKVGSVALVVFTRYRDVYLA